MIDMMKTVKREEGLTLMDGVLQIALMERMDREIPELTDEELPMIVIRISRAIDDEIARIKFERKP